MYEDNFPDKRYRHNIEFLEKNIKKDEVILDLGTENPFSKIMRKRGFNVHNTKGEDLDLNHTNLK